MKALFALYMVVGVTSPATDTHNDYVMIDHGMTQEECRLIMAEIPTTVTETPNGVLIETFPYCEVME